MGIIASTLTSLPTIITCRWLRIYSFPQGNNLFENLWYYPQLIQKVEALKQAGEQIVVKGKVDQKILRTISTTTPKKKRLQWQTYASQFWQNKIDTKNMSYWTIDRWVRGGNIGLCVHTKCAEISSDLRLHIEHERSFSKPMWCSEKNYGIPNMYPKLRIDYERCIQCGKCARNCPVQHLKQGDDGRILIQESSPCIHCFNCVAGCQAQALSLSGDREKAEKFMDKKIQQPKEKPVSAVYPIGG